MPRQRVAFTKRALRLVQRMREERLILCAQLCPLGRADRARDFWLEPGGGEVGPATAEEVIAMGLVAPSDAGLFGDAPQSYRVQG